MAQKIIDVSQFNGTINWTTVAKNIDGVIIRAGYRGYGSSGRLVTDSAFNTNITNAIKNSIPVGVYWVSQAVNEAEAREEVAYLINLLKGKKIQLPVYLDSEYASPNGSGRGDRITKSQRTKCATAWLDAVKSAGYIGGLYCSESWFKDMIDGAAIRNLGYTIWVAKYSTKSPNIGKYDAWQYTDKGRVAGISGTVDINHFYKEFVLNDYREVVQKRFGFKDSTMDYLAKYVYADDLFKKLATAK